MRKDSWMLAFTIVAIVLIFAVAFFALNLGKTADYEKKEKTESGNCAGGKNASGSSAGCNVAANSQSGAGNAECADGEKASCKMDACAGEKICIEGKWSACVALPKVCIPNSTIACAYDSCRFGEARCSPCGNGYGKCELIQCAASERCGKQ